MCAVGLVVTFIRSTSCSCREPSSAVLNLADLFLVSDNLGDGHPLLHELGQRDQQRQCLCIGGGSCARPITVASGTTCPCVPAATASDIRHAAPGDAPALRHRPSCHLSRRTSCYSHLFTLLSPRFSAARSDRVCFLDGRILANELFVGNSLA
jgi:hypothetical protein